MSYLANSSWKKKKRNLKKSQNKTKQTDKKNEKTHTHEDIYKQKKDKNTKQEIIIDKQISKQQGENGKKSPKHYEIKHLQKYHYKTQYFNLNFLFSQPFFHSYNCIGFLVLFQ